MKKWLNLFKETFAEWSDDKCLQIGAAFSFYALGSLVPLLLVIASLGTLFIQFTDAGEQVRNTIIQYVDSATGDTDSEELGPFAKQLNQVAQPSDEQFNGSLISTAIGLGTLLFAASGVFGQLYESMNTVFDVPKEERPQGVWAFVRSKLVAFVMVISVGLLILASIILTTTLAGIITFLALTPAWLVSGITYIVQFAIIGFVFALLFKYLPDIDLRWKDVLPGGFFTAILWAIGSFALSTYIGTSSSFSSYGIIGAVLAFLVYIYYASQILFLGAEFTQVYARSHGSLAQLEGQSPGAVAASGPSAVERALAEARKRELLRKEQELAQAQRRARGAAASSGAVGLLAGTVLGGVALVAGIARTVGRLRGDNT